MQTRWHDQGSNPRSLNPEPSTLSTRPLRSPITSKPTFIRSNYTCTFSKITLQSHVLKAQCIEKPKILTIFINNLLKKRTISIVNIDPLGVPSAIPIATTSKNLVLVPYNIM
jgi:hypothetical protein